MGEPERDLVPAHDEQNLPKTCHLVSFLRVEDSLFVLRVDLANLSASLYF